MKNKDLLWMLAGFGICFCLGATYTIEGTKVTVEGGYLAEYDPNDALFAGLPAPPADWIARYGNNERAADWYFTRVAVSKAVANENAIRKVVERMMQLDGRITALEPPPVEPNDVEEAKEVTAEVTEQLKEDSECGN